jgi:uncharacterized membrane protein
VADDAYDELFAAADRRARERRARRARRAGQGPARPGTGRGHELRHLARSPGGRVLIGAVAAIALAVLVGLVALWPHDGHARGARAVAPTIAAKVARVVEEPCRTPTPQACRVAMITVDGRRSRLSLGPVASAPSVSVGQAIRVTRTPAMPAGTPAPPHYEPYAFADADRHGSLLWMGLLIAAAATLLLRLRGLLAVAGVALSLAVVLLFLVPAILDGRPALLVALVSSLAVMFITLVLTNGLGAQTLAAALGISATLLLSCGLATLGVHVAHLDGKTDDVTLALGAQSAHLSLQGVVLASMLIGALGVLADTAVTQASAVMALRRANPALGARRLYREAFVVGRDHLSATIHTLVLAYTGAALPLLLVMRQAHLPTADALNAQTIAEPIVATVVGCAALIVAVPLTTALAAMLVARVPAAALPEGGGHGHAH